VAGQYKRRTQLICVVIALAIAAMFNIDSFHLFKTLWNNAALAVAVTAPAASNELDALAGLQTLPIGWGSFPPQLTPAGYFLMFVGWLVTASSAFFGAPFWFDLLQNITQLRGTGPKPSTASDDT
jgi:hypothetical protein